MITIIKKVRGFKLNALKTICRLGNSLIERVVAILSNGLIASLGVYANTNKAILTIILIMLCALLDGSTPLIFFG